MVSSPAVALDAPMRPADALDRIVYLLDRSLAPAVKARSFARASAIVHEMEPDEIIERARTGTLREIEGIGATTEKIITDALEGRIPTYLRDLEASTSIAVTERAGPYRHALRGDCHLHSNWSDGGTPIETMARTARDLGHEYIVLTDHSGRLTIAHGLDRERLEAQLAVVQALNDDLAPFRILTGLEVDILEDGTLDMDDETLARLDLVVASVHSKLKMDRQSMTRRMVIAMTNPHADVLGHCTGRKVAHDGVDPVPGALAVRAGSDFDAEIVFTACAQFDKAVEINCRPERRDPPTHLLHRALAARCKVAIDTDAHAPGQLEWQAFGCDKAAAADVPLASVINSWTADELTAWTASHG